MAVLILHPWTRCLFHFLSQYLYFIFSEFTCFWGSHICVSHWNSRFLIFFFFPDNFIQEVPNKTKRLLNWGSEKMQCALWAACIRWQHCDLSGGQLNLIAFLTTVKNKIIQVVTVLQHRNTRGYIYDLVWAVNKKKLHNFKGCCFRWCVISLTWLYWYLLTCVQTVLYVQKKWILIFKLFCWHMTHNVNASCS